MSSKVTRLGLYLNQSTPQTVINGTPIFDVGLTSNGVISVNTDGSNGVAINPVTGTDGGYISFNNNSNAYLGIQGSVGEEIFGVGSGGLPYYLGFGGSDGGVQLFAGNAAQLTVYPDDNWARVAINAPPASNTGLVINSTGAGMGAQIDFATATNAAIGVFPDDASGSGFTGAVNDALFFVTTDDQAIQFGIVDTIYADIRSGYTRFNNDVIFGINTAAPARGFWDIDDLQTIDSVPNINATQTAGGNINYVSTDYIEFNVYAYRTLPNSTVLYSSIAFGPSAAPAATPTPYKLVFTWDAVSGAEGYIVVASGALTGYTVGKWKDVGNVLTITYGDGSEASWNAAPATVTPTSPYGADIYIDKVTGDITTEQGYNGINIKLHDTHDYGAGLATRTGSITYTQDNSNDAWGVFQLSPDLEGFGAGCILRMGGTNGYSFEFTADHRLLLVGATGGNIAVFAAESVSSNTPIVFRTGGDNWGAMANVLTIDGDGGGITVLGDATIDSDSGGLILGADQDMLLYSDGAGVLYIKPLAANTDTTVNFFGTTNSGQFLWMEDEDYFLFNDDIVLASGETLGVGVDPTDSTLHVKGGTTYITKSESTGANNFNAFVSTSGTGEYGIWNDALYFQALNSLANGIKFFPTSSSTPMFSIAGNGTYLGGSGTPTAVLHIAAGTATANTAPIKLTSGTVMTTAEAGAIEFNTDDFFATITTGAARKGFILDNGSRLTSGKIPVATTNGRLIDVTAQTELTDELTSITHTAPGTPDYAIQDLSAGGFGFATKDEGNTVLSVILNLQTRVNELETKLVALGLLVDAD